MDPAQRVWNAQSEENGKLVLADPPKGNRLPLPTAPPYPILEGYIVPIASNGRPRAGLTVAETVQGTCTSDGYVNHPDSVRCGWPEHGFDYLDNYCWKAPGRLRLASVVLCPEGAGSTRFVRVKLSKRGS
jgi:hypothetical protein